MSNNLLRTKLHALCDEIVRRGGEPARERYVLPFEAVAEIERLNKAIGEQTDMVRRWRNRYNRQRAIAESEKTARVESRKAEAAVIRDLRAKLATAQSEITRVKANPELTEEQRRLIQIGEGATALWGFLNGERVKRTAPVTSVTTPVGQQFRDRAAIQQVLRDFARVDNSWR